MMTDVEWIQHWLQQAPVLDVTVLERIAEHLDDEDGD